VWCVSGSGARGKISLSLLAGVLAKRCGGWRRSRSPRVRANRSVVRAAITSRSVRVSRIAGGNALRAQPEPVGGGGKGGGSGVRRTRSAMVKQNFICWQQVQYFFGLRPGLVASSVSRVPAYVSANRLCFLQPHRTRLCLEGMGLSTAGVAGSWVAGKEGLGDSGMREDG
jgi:hypothetical protein